MPSLQAGQTIVRAGMGVLVFAALAAAWELLARQAPGSMLYLGMLPEPISALRELAIVLGLLLVVAGMLAGWAFGAPPPRWVAVALHGGALLALVAQGYGAATGMYGVQLQDLRADALPVFLAKHLGLLAFSLGFGEIARRVWARPAPPG